MLNGPFALALTAGMAATVNPCGFALLPAYLSTFVGLDDRGTRRSAIGRAIAVSLVMTAGFVTVFGLFGAVLTKVVDGIESQLPWATLVIGIGLVGLGIWLLRGHQITINIPKFQRGGSDGSLLSMYLFGVSYAVASLSCTIAPFLAVTTTTFNNESYLSGVAVFVMYGVGMGVVVSVLTLAVALARDGLVARFRSLLPKMNLVAGVLLVVAGLYVAYYGYYEVRVFHFDGSVEDPIIDAALDVQGWLLRLVPSTSNAPWYAVAGGVLLAGAWAWSRWRRSDDGSSIGPPAEPATDATAEDPDSALTA